MDDSQELLPVGVIGEICIGGAGLARGYLNLPELTSSKFVVHPFRDGARLYRSGDLGRWLPDGNIEFIGRKDSQIKLRGYRIELGEVESVLNGSALVSQGVVVVDGEESSRRLVGYVVPSGSYDKQGIEAYLRDHLPEYMVPSLLVELDSLPLTSNGKVDRKSLPAVDASSLLESTYVAPTTDTELALASIWKELLGVDQVGIHDNFFELGGDSIMVIQFVNRCNRLGYTLFPKDIFKNQTIFSLAHILKEERHELVIREEGVLKGELGLLPIQKQFFSNSFEDISHYNQSVLLEIAKSVTYSELDSVINRLLSHHDVLRFHYKNDQGTWIQTYGEGSQEVLNLEDLTDSKKELLSTAITELCDGYQKSLSLEGGDIVKFVLIRTPSQESSNRLFVTVHHLAIDGVSWRILLEDLNVSLASHMNGEDLSLSAKGTSYRQFVSVLEDYAISPKLLQEKDYWISVVEGFKPLPVDFDSATSYMGDVEDYRVRLDVSETSYMLQQLHKVYGTEINDILLSALGQTLSNWTGESEILIGLEGHGREDIFENVDVSRTMGWFTSLYPVKLCLHDIRTKSDLVKSVKEQLREIPNGGIGYGVLSHLSPDKEVRALYPDNIWDVIFNYLGQLDNITKSTSLLSGASESTGLSLSPKNRFTNKLSINSGIIGGSLEVIWSYSSNDYKKETIQKLAESYLHNLQDIIESSKLKNNREFTPSDFGLEGKLPIKELDSLFNNFSIDFPISYVSELSPMQEGMLFHSLFSKTTGVYLNQFVLSFSSSSLEVDSLQKSLNYLIAGHSILRSSFVYEEISHPVQLVHSDISFPLEVKDWSMKSSELQVESLASFIASDQHEGFDFSKPPLARAILLDLGGGSYKLVLTYHHILLDGWSVPILMKELFETYEVYASGKVPEKPMEDHYRDYINYIASRDRESEEEFWYSYLKSSNFEGSLPFVDTKVPHRNKGEGIFEEKELIFDEDFTNKIKEYAKFRKVTVNSLVQGVWSILLSRYTNSSEIVFGVTVSGRPSAMSNIESRVGLYINTLPLVVKDIEQASLDTVFSSIQENHLRTREYQYSSLSDIKKYSGIEKEFFDSVLVFQNYPIAKIKDSSKSLGISEVEANEHNNYILTLIVSSRERLTIQLKYNSSLLNSVYADLIKDHIKEVFTQILDESTVKVSEVSLVSERERSLLLEEFNSPVGSYPSTTIVDLFSSQVSENPSGIALVYGEVSLTYQELNEKANRLSNHLRDRYGIKTH